MATDAAKQGLSPKDSRTAIAGNGHPSGHETPKSSSRLNPTDRTSPEDSDPRRLVTEVGASGVFVPWRCPGPAGTWPCSLEIGHGGDHERFAPEPVTPLKDLVGELSAAIRNLRQERNELLLTCADLLQASKRALIFLQDNGMSHGADLARAIKKAEAR